MSRTIKVSDEVYDALQVLKDYPSTSFSDIVKGLIEIQFPGDFFGTTGDATDRLLILEELPTENPPHGEIRREMKAKKLSEMVTRDEPDRY